MQQRIADTALANQTVNAEIVEGVTVAGVTVEELHFSAVEERHFSAA